MNVNRFVSVHIHTHIYIFSFSLPTIAKFFWSHHFVTAIIYWLVCLFSFPFSQLMYKCTDICIHRWEFSQTNCHKSQKVHTFFVYTSVYLQHNNISAMRPECIKYWTREVHKISHSTHLTAKTTDFKLLLYAFFFIVNQL